jgi:hypothetical protein
MTRSLLFLCGIVFSCWEVSQGVGHQGGAEGGGAADGRKAYERGGTLRRIVRSRRLLLRLQLGRLVLLVLALPVLLGLRGRV